MTDNERSHFEMLRDLLCMGLKCYDIPDDVRATTYAVLMVWLEGLVAGDLERIGREYDGGEPSPESLEKANTTLSRAWAYIQERARASKAQEN